MSLVSESFYRYRDAQVCTVADDFEFNSSALGVGHVDHGYFLQVELQPIQQITYALRQGG